MPPNSRGDRMGKETVAPIDSELNPVNFLHWVPLYVESSLL